MKEISQKTIEKHCDWWIRVFMGKNYKAEILADTIEVEEDKEGDFLITYKTIYADRLERWYMFGADLLKKEMRNDD